MKNPFYNLALSCKIYCLFYKHYLLKTTNLSYWNFNSHDYFALFQIIRGKSVIKSFPYYFREINRGMLLQDNFIILGASWIHVHINNYKNFRSNFFHSIALKPHPNIIYYKIKRNLKLFEFEIIEVHPL